MGAPTGLPGTVFSSHLPGGDAAGKCRRIIPNRLGGGAAGLLALAGRVIVAGGDRNPVPDVGG